MSFEATYICNRAHESEKQYQCSSCSEKFRSKVEADNHQNGMHLRGESWSCSNVRTYDRIFQKTSHQPDKYVVCGFCGDDFPRSGTSVYDMPYTTDRDWRERVRHLEGIHKIDKCNKGKMFYREDRLKQHLKHSHGSIREEWRDTLAKLYCLDGEEEGYDVGTQSSICLDCLVTSSEEEME